ncbi:uncharacterized protein TA11280 [Theileria annulata]|uniref:Uncharacterized protein n=1 Tax=Theileria annulata TaxID=5874 RepID=Q4U8K6_THEAN|nr:uncharacterized protein TA11280 [Theileria annulata]CAI76847.1 hypothetical protein TA11280 [Theileria annulata]|eukprot:XP_953472.1 hypothetical protein TA11280 [Theileria annulata]
MYFINFYIIFNLILPISYKCVNSQDNLESQGTPGQNMQHPQKISTENSNVNETKDQNGSESPLGSFNNEVVDVNDTVKGNVLKENPGNNLLSSCIYYRNTRYYIITSNYKVLMNDIVEKLNELSRDISKEISQNPYYKIPELTRKIRDIAILHPDVMKKLGVYVIPIQEQEDNSGEEGGEKGELIEEKHDESKEKEMRSEIDELMDKTEMMEAMTPEQKLEYIPELKETIVYQILKNRNILKELSDKLGYKNVQDLGNHQQYQNSQDFSNYQYGNYPNYQYGNYGNYQNYYNGSYPDYQNYYQYGNNGNYGNYPYYGY